VARSDAVPAAELKRDAVAIGEVDDHDRPDGKGDDAGREDGDRGSGGRRWDTMFGSCQHLHRLDDVSGQR
jgi:hypothetical protein